MKIPLLTISILIGISSALADDTPAKKGPSAHFLLLVKALTAMIPLERNYAPGLRMSQEFEDRRWADPEYVWPVKRIPLPPPSRELRPLLPIPGVGRQVTHTIQR